MNSDLILTKNVSLKFSTQRLYKNIKSHHEKVESKVDG